MSDEYKNTTTSPQVAADENSDVRQSAPIESTDLNSAHTSQQPPQAGLSSAAQNRNPYPVEKDREKLSDIEGLFYKPNPDNGVKYKSKILPTHNQKVFYRDGEEPHQDSSFVGVAFKVTGHVFYFLAPKFPIHLQQMVMVETNFGLVIARIVQLPEHLSEFKLEGPPRPIVRPAYHHDFSHLDEIQKKVRYSIQYFKERVLAMHLDLKPVHVEYINNNKKAIFYFTAPERVDFRELVKDLLKELRVRIELRQIGVRDETKIAGGIGPCGQTLCCSTFLRDYEPLSVKMARDQGLAVNSDKINGVCGRLKCCLAYEMPVYEELGKDLPEPGLEVLFEKQRHQVLSRNVFDRTVTLRSIEGDFKILDFHEEYKWEQQKIVSKNAPPAPPITVIEPISTSAASTLSDSAAASGSSGALPLQQRSSQNESATTTTKIQPISHKSESRGQNNSPQGGDSRAKNSGPIRNNQSASHGSQHHPSQSSAQGQQQRGRHSGNEGRSSSGGRGNNGRNSARPQGRSS